MTLGENAVRTLCGCLIGALSSWTVAGADEASSPRSGGGDVSSLSATADQAPATAPAAEGAVQQALRQIYTIPRKPAHPNRVARPASDAPTNPQRAESTTPVPPADRRSNSEVSELDESEGVEYHKDPRPPIRDDDGPYTGNALGGYPGTFVGPYFYPYYRSGGGLSSRQRRWSDYRYFGGRPSQYGFGREDFFGDSYAGGAYRFGFNRGYNRGYFDRRATEREESLLAHSGNAMSRGLQAFREARYQEAADAFRLATELNQGDPAARIYAAHSLFAIGRYRDAVKHLRRALELQPRIALLTYDMREDYRERADFEDQLAALRGALAASPRDEDRLFMLGYVQYFTWQRAEAHATFQTLSRMNAHDRVVSQLVEIARPADVVLDARRVPAKP
jgi:hypothetical protein